MRTRTVASLVFIAVVAVAVAAIALLPRPDTALRTGHARARVGIPTGEPKIVARPAAPRVRARAAILVDLATDRVLFAKHAGQRRPIASLAKIMTALVVLDRSNLSDVVRVGQSATRTEPINIGLEKGERITVRNLMYGLLLWSGNDTAVALAQHVSRRVPDFVTAMNAEARALGLSDTRFMSPNGLDDRGFSTAGDVAELTRDALADPRLATFVATRRHRIPGPRRQVHRLRNLNAMLFRYAGATGVKTGYTHAAGTCVVTSASRGGHSLLSVVLGDRTGDAWRSAYRDSANLLDYGFAMERGSSTR